MQSINFCYVGKCWEIEEATLSHGGTRRYQAVHKLRIEAECKAIAFSYIQWITTSSQFMLVASKYVAYVAYASWGIVHM